MKNNRIEVFNTFLMISILIVFMINSIIFSVIPKILSKLNIGNDTINNFFNIKKSENLIDYSKIYPLENNINLDSPTLVQKYISFLSMLKEYIEKGTSSNLYGYEKMVELSYLYDDLLSYKIVSNSSKNSRIVIDKEYLSTISNKFNISSCASELINLNSYLQSLNINLLYVQAPSKISSTQEYSKIYKDYNNENVDDLLKSIDGKVTYLDLRKNILNENLNNLELFFKTDHHWLPETGLWATKLISEFLNNKYDMNLKVENVESSRYNYKVYPNMFLGSDGRYVSLAKASPENFTLITPKFDTKLNIKIPQKSIDTTGTFDETLLDWSQLKYANYYKINQYATYAYGDCQLIEVENKYVNNNKKILILKNSFANVVSPFLALETENVSIIDLRLFNGSLKSYIQEYKPDLVMILYHGNAVLDPNDEDSSQSDLLWTNLNN